jgi:hypothetical protein
VLDGITAEGDIMIGVNILRRALEEPLRRLATTSGYHPLTLVDSLRRIHILRQDKGMGFDVVTKRYVNMIEAGITDPVKVTRSAVANACSVAGMILTTGTLITDVPVTLSTKSTAISRTRSSARRSYDANLLPAPSIDSEVVIPDLPQMVIEISYVDRADAISSEDQMTAILVNPDDSPVEVLSRSSHALERTIFFLDLETFAPRQNIKEPMNNISYSVEVVADWVRSAFDHDYDRYPLANFGPWLNGDADIDMSIGATIAVLVSDSTKLSSSQYSMLVSAGSFVIPKPDDFEHKSDRARQEMLSALAQDLAGPGSLSIGTSGREEADSHRTSLHSPTSGSAEFTSPNIGISEDDFRELFDRR